MAETIYLYTVTTLNGAYLHKTILASSITDVTTEFDGLLFDPTLPSDQLAVTFNNALSAGDETVLDGLIVSYQLPSNKSQRKIEIDTRTRDLIAAGFTYASKVFSLSIAAQINWTNAGLNAGALTYPYRVGTLDDNDFYDFVSVADMQGAYGTALGVKSGHLSSGTSLKNDITTAADQAALDAIVDTR